LIGEPSFLLMINSRPERGILALIASWKKETARATWDSGSKSIYFSPPFPPTQNRTSGAPPAKDT